MSWRALRGFRPASPLSHRVLKRQSPLHRPRLMVHARTRHPRRLVAVASVESVYLPARKATTIDPMRALGSGSVSIAGRAFANPHEAIRLHNATFGRMNRLLWAALACTAIALAQPAETAADLAARYGGPASNGETGINGIAFDSDGNVYLGGSTNQTDFPATAGAFMTQIGKADLPSGYVLSTVPRQGFVAKFSPSFALIYASLIGGVSPKLPYPCNGTCYTTGATNSVSTIAVDAAGVVTVAGTTSALDFPATH